LATLDLARARIFSLVRLGFPLDSADKFAFGAGASVVTVRLASGDEGSTRARPSIEGIALWCQSDELQRIASALTAAGSSTPHPSHIHFIRRTTMPLTIGDNAPNFDAETTEGRINFHEWLGDSWGVLFSHPKDFTPVCTTELGHMAKLKPEFDRRGVKVIALSVDPVSNHSKWSVDIADTQGAAPNYPMIGDTQLAVSKLYGMLPATLEGTSEGRTAADNQTVRCVFVVGPDKKIKLSIIYPMTTGRNFDEVLRVIDSLQLTARHKVATPAQWKQGNDVIIAGSLSDDDARKVYPQGWLAPRPYLRIVPQPA